MTKWAGLGGVTVVECFYLGQKSWDEGICGTTGQHVCSHSTCLTYDSALCCDDLIRVCRFLLIQGSVFSFIYQRNETEHMFVQSAPCSSFTSGTLTDFYILSQFTATPLQQLVLVLLILNGQVDIFPEVFVPSCLAGSRAAAEVSLLFHNFSLFLQFFIEKVIAVCAATEIEHNKKHKQTEDHTSF